MTHPPLSPVLRRRSHAMRQDMPEPERRFWFAVRAHRFHGLGFRRQVAIAGFIVDFCCHERRVVVEIDGATHADPSRDQARTATIEAEGYRVLRYWNADIMANLDGVLTDLEATLGIGAEVPLSNSPPQGGREPDFVIAPTPMKRTANSLPSCGLGRGTSGPDDPQATADLNLSRRS